MNVASENEMLSSEVLALLQCVRRINAERCQGALNQQDKELVCAACGARYPIREGIGVVLPDETRKRIGESD